MVKDYKKKLKKGEKIKLYDYSTWEPEKCYNGGAYAYSLTPEPTKDEEGNLRYYVRYCTSSDFEFCERYGVFKSCSKCYSQDCETPVSLKEAMALVKRFIDEEEDGNGR